MCISYVSVVIIKHHGQGKTAYLNFFNVHNGKDSAKSLSRQQAWRLVQVAESSYLEVSQKTDQIEVTGGCQLSKPTAGDILSPARLR